VDREVFMVKNIQTLQTAKGDDYYDCTLANALGSTAMKIWDLTDKLKVGDFVELYAQCVKHPKYGPQWKVNKYYKADKYTGDADFSKIIFKPDVDTLFDEMVNYPYKNHTIERLKYAFTFDNDIVDRFKSIPASLANHHSYNGGLVQHTYEVWTMTSQLLDTIELFPCYPKIQRDVALFGALVHDVSKVFEYNWNVTEGKYDRSNSSILVGNPAGGLLVLGTWLKQLDGETLDPLVLDLIQHIFISHQMRPEWGSPVTPRCLEALAVATADGFSANVSHVAMGLEQDKIPNDSFTSPYYYFMGNASIWKTPDFDSDLGRPSSNASTASKGSTKAKKPNKATAPGGLEPVEAKEVEIAKAGDEKKDVDTSKKKGMIT